MSINTVFNKARILTFVSLSVVLFLSACAGGTSNQIDAQSHNELLTSRQSALAPKAALPNSAEQFGAPVVEEQAMPLAKAAQPLDALQGAAPQEPAAQLVVPLIDGPAQAAAVDLSLPMEPRIGARAPQFAMQTLDGQSLNMDALIGHPVVISYWATWCVPCQQELPILQKLYEEYAGSGLVVLTVNAIEQDSLDKVQTMLAEKGMNLPVLLDAGSVFASDYQAIFFPTTFYIDPSGVIRFIKLGDSSEEDLRTHVDSLMRGDL